MGNLSNNKGRNVKKRSTGGGRSRKNKKNKIVTAIISFMLLVLLAIFEGETNFIQGELFNMPKTTQSSAQNDNNDEKLINNEAGNETSILKVHFLNVGQADCILIESDKEYMLVDAGNNEDGSFIVEYLQEQGVETLKYVIGTHPHEDHIGSLDTVIPSFDIGMIIMPEKEHTSNTFADVLTAVEEKGLAITAPEIGDIYTIGSARFTIIAPNDEYGNELNNWSVGIKLTMGKNSFIMCGDAETGAENDIINNGIDLSADVLKVNHHGSNTSSSESFIEAINPQYAVISVGTNNSYGHPHQEILDIFERHHIQILCTDEKGTIIAISDGVNIKWEFSAMGNP